MEITTRRRKRFNEVAVEADTQNPHLPNEDLPEVSIEPPIKDNKKNKWRFYSRKNDLMVAIETDILEPISGKPMRNPQGQKITELHTFKFKWQRFTTSDETVYKMLINAPGYGGDVENDKNIDTAAMFWLNGIPKEVLDDLKRQRSYLTHDPMAYDDGTEL
ncbi:MAG: hypothetical protein KatS3mg083_107 [Candidatus Dojkabacteria bacterium]|nr:MAG: hypothetical protein KatS3mg083_107 [Candidatus Dojkabacteria bacterium]